MVAVKCPAMMGKVLLPPVAGVVLAALSAVLLMDWRLAGTCEDLSKGYNCLAMALQRGIGIAKLGVSCCGWRMLNGI